MIYKFVMLYQSLLHYNQLITTQVGKKNFRMFKKFSNLNDEKTFRNFHSWSLNKKKWFS